MSMNAVYSNNSILVDGVHVPPEKVDLVAKELVLKPSKGLIYRLDFSEAGVDVVIEGGTQSLLTLLNRQEKETLRWQLELLKKQQLTKNKEVEESDE